jgi:beta-lactamase regulating signal transducer with metallopeptidase domain
MDNKTWFKHVLILTLGLLIYYAVSYIIIYTTIMNPANSGAIVAAGQSPGAQIGSSIAALFPIPAILWVVGVVLCKWISF